MGGKLTQAPATPELVVRLRSCGVRAFWRLRPSRVARTAEDAALFLSAADALEAQQARIAELEAESAALTKALTGLTCGGSEFFIRKGDRYVADIDACVSWVRRTKEDAHRRTVKAITEQKASQALADRYEKALERLIEYFEDGEAHGEGAYDEGCPACQALQLARQALSSQGRHEGGGE